MSDRSDYSEWPMLGQIYLEDSYVMEIVERPSELTFRMEFVLRELHPKYNEPTGDEQYCYERGALTFRGARNVRWLERNPVRSFDATGQSDLGNIDVLYCEDDRFAAAGDWGRVTFEANEVEVSFDNDQVS
jgi:hypothetical protein